METNELPSCSSSHGDTAAETFFFNPQNNAVVRGLSFFLTLVAHISCHRLDLSIASSLSCFTLLCQRYVMQIDDEQCDDDDDEDRFADVVVR